MELGIVAQRGNARANALAGDVRVALSERGVGVLVDVETGGQLDVEGVPVAEMADCPMVVSVGGDGTFLYVARQVGSTPILGVNLGEVGFLNAVSPEEATERVLAEVDRIRETGAPRYREVSRLTATGDGWSIDPAMNEVVVQAPQRGRGNGLEVEVLVDGSPYAETHADGVLIATPTGSTAYNLSEAGPLVHPDVAGLVVNGMAPVEPMRPLVVPREAEVTVRGSGVEQVVVTSDGSERRWIDAPATVTVGLADEPGRIAGPRSDFFRALEKLG
ncbi:MAG TPA: NAD(+)/NADH kinase [Halobacteriales archaeon]|nr:NAD(+)/NADH kinase [Halobacteriales archaeon]